VGQIDHFGDGDINSLTSLELRGNRAESEGNLVAFEWDKVTLDIRDVDKMLRRRSPSASLALPSLRLIVRGLDEAVTSRFAKVCYHTSLSPLLDSLTD